MLKWKPFSRANALKQASSEKQEGLNKTLTKKNVMLEK